MSVVGIDFGNLNTVVAVARNRGIDVITNEVSNRKTPSLVSFGEKQRYLGESAKTQEISNFKNTVSTLKRLIGRPFSDPDVMGVEKKFVNCGLVEGERGEVGASVMYQNERKTFSFTQLVAMYFNKVKEFTAKEIKIPVTDVVISCPGWFTDRQRRAIMDAAEVSGLTCLRVMNDLTAAALGYGITKLDLPDPSLNPSVKPRTVVFVDLGHSSYQVSVVSFVKGKLVVKGTAYDRNLGGRDFDEALVQHYADEFGKKYRMDIRGSAKAMHRLRAGCEKVKKILSANAVTVLNVECLLDDKDVSAQVQRADYEVLIEPLVARLAPPLERALKAAGITNADVDAVELIGGSTRIPIVKSTLANFFGDKLSTTLNQDEAVARGCALQCAIISPVFKVRDFSVQDWNAMPLVLGWDPAQCPAPKSGDAVESEMEVFSLGNSVPSTKILTFYRALRDEELAQGNGAADFNLEFKYKPGSLAESGAAAGSGDWIGKWSVKGIKKIAVKEGEAAVAENNGADAKATIKVKARLDGNTVVAIESAQQIEEVMVPVKEEAPAKKPEEATSATPEGEKKEGAETAPMETDAEQKEGEAAATPATEKAPAAAPEPKFKKVTRKHELVVVGSTTGASKELLQRFEALEGEMMASDRLVIDTAERRNALEEYVYDVRSKLEMAWSEFIAEDARIAFMKELSAMEDWLYTEEGEEATKSVYVEKLTQLRKTGDPIGMRYREAETRPSAEKHFREYVNSVIVNVTAGDDRYAHIAKEELDKVLSECQSKLNWLNDSIAKQNETPKYSDPVVTTEQINKTKEALFYSVNPILTKPKPKPVEKKEEKKEEGAEKAAEGEAAAAEEKKDEVMTDAEDKKEKEEMDVD
ncbi:adenyl-nucleotide exchange factor sse1 [Quaeritorhiza haematococci]|nr:adenyl-nucleotide exchange factor sse1 [Quaeritorhiza haematococci]